MVQHSAIDPLPSALAEDHKLWWGSRLPRRKKARGPPRRCRSLLRSVAKLFSLIPCSDNSVLNSTGQKWWKKWFRLNPKQDVIALCTCDALWENRRQTMRGYHDFFPIKKGRPEDKSTVLPPRSVISSVIGSSSSPHIDKHDEFPQL